MVVKNRLSPEFLNRLDAVVQFNALDKIQIKNIVKKHLTVLQNMLSTSKVVAMLDDSLIDFIAENGFDAELGARPIERYIEKNISIPLSKEILFGNLVNGGEVKIYADKEIKFDFLKKYTEKKRKKKQEEVN